MAAVQPSISTKPRTKLAAFLSFGSRKHKSRDDPPPPHTPNNARDFGIRSLPGPLPSVPTHLSSPSVASQTLYAPEHDPFVAQRHKPSSPRMSRQTPVVTLSGAQSPSSSSRQDSNHFPRIEDTPPQPPSSASLSIFRKRTESARSTVSKAATTASSALLPIGSSSTAPHDSKRGSWHSRSRSSVTSVDMQLPPRLRSPRASDEFSSSILDAVANIGNSIVSRELGLRPAAGPSMTSSSPDIASLASSSHHHASQKSQRPRTSGSTPNPLSAFPAPPPTLPAPPRPTTSPGSTTQVSRARSYTTGASDARRTPKSPNTLRKLLPSTPPTHSLPPTPLPPLPIPAVADRSSQSSAGSTSAYAIAPAQLRALSPIMPSPTTASRLASPKARGSSSRVSSGESSSLLFANVGESDRSESGSARGQRRSSTLAATGDLPSPRPSPRGFMTQTPPHVRESVASDMGPSILPHHSFTAATQTLRKATSQSQLASTSNGRSGKHKPDSSTGSATTIKAAVMALGATPARALDSGANLLRKQRSMHSVTSVASVAIPPIPRQAVPQPESSPPGPQNLLHSFSLRRLSSGPAHSKHKNDSDVSISGVASSSAGDAKRSSPEDVPRAQRARQASSHTSGGGSQSTRPTSPAVSTFFDDTDSVTGSAFSHDASLGGTGRSRRGSQPMTRRPSDFRQHIIPPEEFVSNWPGPAGHSGDSDSSAPPSSGAGKRIPSKSMPNSPTVPRSATTLGSPRDESLEMVLSSPVGFGGGLALVPMPPPRRDQSQSRSAGRARGTSFLAEAAGENGRMARQRPSISALSTRSDTGHGLRSVGSANALRSTSEAAFVGRPRTGDLGTYNRGTAKTSPVSSEPHPRTADINVRARLGESGVRSRSSSKASPISPVSEDTVAPLASSSAARTAPNSTDLARKRSILKKPSFLDMDPDEAASHRAASPRTRRVSHRERERDSAYSGTLVASASLSRTSSAASSTPRPPPMSPVPIPMGLDTDMHFPAPPPAAPYAPQHADEFASDSFLDFGRMSMDPMQNGGGSGTDESASADMSSGGRFSRFGMDNSTIASFDYGSPHGETSTWRS
ncbi:hypothetical protein BKA62DRAFT_222636 [Auriculariales sp. MPI-PUGE-AT-0066]|nr:hypothetical protein BKA62DRAFT_222636 [Auriculariales sp. MPI-PUGE-AT-0066]